ncbi:MAG: hypothetical protein ACFFBY_15825 [Promethearchaeota archaeon]
MSIGIIKVNNKDFYDRMFPDISELIIPFSEFFKNHNSHYIYTGKERIPFTKRDPEFIETMKKEFL